MEGSSSVNGRASGRTARERFDRKRAKKRSKRDLELRFDDLPSESGLCMTIGGGPDFPKYYSKFPCAEREEKFLEIYIVWEGSRAGP